MALAPVSKARVNIVVLRPWIDRTISQLVGPDDVLTEYIIELLDGCESTIAAADLTPSLEAFLGDKTSSFLDRLWPLLESAQENPRGVPVQLIREKELELRQRREAQSDREPRNYGSHRSHHAKESSRRGKGRFEPYARPVDSGWPRRAVREESSVVQKHAPLPVSEATGTAAGHSAAGETASGDITPKGSPSLFADMPTPPSPSPEELDELFAEARGRASRPDSQAVAL